MRLLERLEWVEGWGMAVGGAGYVFRPSESGGVAETVVTPDMRIQSDYELVGKVRRLERVMGSGTPGVVAELELAFVRSRDRKLLFSESYIAEVAMRDDTVPASVEAMNQAIADIFESFVADAGGTLQTASD